MGRIENKIWGCGGGWAEDTMALVGLDDDGPLFCCWGVA